MIAGTVLLVLAPVFLVVALLILIASPGPVIYAQERVGKGGRVFSLLKFRSMVVNADRIGPPVSGNSDARTTWLGRHLRRSKLDELPQLVNVMRGEMTLIGPRPEVARYVEYYSPSERVLLSVRPGLTGPGQLWFWTDQACELDDADDPEREYLEHHLHPKLALDLDYLEHRSVSRDLDVLRKTLSVMLKLRR